MSDTGPPSWLNLLCVLGEWLAGDADGYTLYTTHKGRVIAYPSRGADKPPTFAQSQQRARFRQAQQNWRQETAATKSLWELAVKKACICATGQNLYISASLKPNSTTIAAINRRYNLGLQQPQFIPW